jgi:hypothetical protein
MITDDVVVYCRGKLEIPTDIHISIEYEDLSDDGVKGWAYDAGDDGEYDIEIEQTLSVAETIKTVCHEMVHIKQMIDGRELSEAEAYEQEDILANGYL